MVVARVNPHRLRFSGALKTALAIKVECSPISHEHVLMKAVVVHRAFYEFCWHLGGARSGVTSLTAEDIDWRGKVVSFRRHKTGTVSIIRFGKELEAILRTLPQGAAVSQSPQDARGAPGDGVRPRLGAVRGPSLIPLRWTENENLQRKVALVGESMCARS